jgi:hypothetical protein
VLQTIVLLRVSLGDRGRVDVTNIGGDSLDEGNDIEQGEFRDDGVLVNATR